MRIYTMTHWQSSVWCLGGADAVQLEQTLASYLVALACPDAVLVVLANGTPAFIIEGRAPQGGAQ